VICTPETFKIATQAIDSNQDWLAPLSAIGILVITIVCAYVGFQLFRKGM
jgi:hypothetical protein